MSAYVGLTAFKQAIGLTADANDTVDDGVLQSVIFRASALVDGYLTSIRPGYVAFAASSNANVSVGSNTRTYDGSGTETLFIDDAASVSSVTIGGTLVPSTDYVAWPYNDTPKTALIFTLPSTSAYGLLQSHWTLGTANVAATCYFGLPDIPNDVEQVTLAVGVTLWRRYQAGDFTQRPEVAMGGVGQVLNDPELLGILEGLYPRWGQPGVWGG